MAMRRYSFFFRKPGMGGATFSAYYKGPHGHLIAGLPQFWNYTDRYIQNHVLPGVPNLTGGQPAWDGITEVWEPEEVNSSRAFFEDRVYKEYVAPDELNFITVEGKLRLSAVSSVLIDGPSTKIKLLTLIRRRSGLSTEEFRRRWQEHGEMVRSVPAVQKYVRRFVLNNVIPESVSSASGHPGYDGIAELFYDNVDDALAAQTSVFQSANIKASKDGFASAQRVGQFLVQEIVIPRPPFR
jgi:hypothetical protein